MGVPGILPPTRQALDQQEYYMGQSDSLSSDVKPFWMQSQQSLIESENRSFQDIDLYIPHQTSNSILDLLAQSMGAHSNKLFRCLDHYGNCGSATLPIALAEAMEGQQASGRRILLNAVGGGLAWGSLLINT